MDVSQLGQLRALQAENAQLKKMYAELAQVHDALPGRCRKKALTPSRKVNLAQFLTKEHGLSARQACRTVRLSRSILYYQPKPKNDGPVIEAVMDDITKNPRHGFCLCIPAL